MPAKGDHEARRADVAAAVWRVLAAEGFGGLTMRAVAAELDASTGMLTHYFTGKDELVRYAHSVAADRTDSRPMLRAEAPGLAALRVALVNVLPTTPENVAMSRVWVSFWDAALGDASLSSAQRERYVRWRERLRVCVVDAQERGELAASDDAEDVAVSAAAFAHGLVVQALFDPQRLPPARQLSLVDDFLAGLRGR
ncbi:TetR/AcrR family transcriptional regulator [Actinophytocola oryzae]|uniref:TetR family transcriptional regulator n=1 Tax=Actinophytocola oryzae TaxID=502181 RepID=A0A4R7VCK1_9PSEU|nr:TetR/AcrR family transcriptional regulator [Actinophytocola oryzae]TDV46830.1 TetR family transcriptional regulator [Actinophytocola oryzae]